MREMLKGLLPRLLRPQVFAYYLVFEGKQDLERRLVPRLQGWLKPASRMRSCELPAASLRAGIWVTSPPSSEGLAWLA